MGNVSNWQTPNNEVAHGCTRSGAPVQSVARHVAPDGRLGQEDKAYSDALKKPGTDFLPEQRAEELLRLGQLHHEALVGYISGLKELRTEPPRRHVSTPVQKLTVSVREAAIMLGISRAAVYDAVHQKRIPTISFGRRLVIPRAALDRLLMVERGEEEEAAEQSGLLQWGFC
jgi:excisionase family DNA binding protein